MEKTLEQDAVLRKTERVEATVERREWVELEKDAKPADILQSTIIKSAPTEVSTELLTGKTTNSMSADAMPERAVSRQISKEPFHKVDEVVLPTGFMNSVHLTDSDRKAQDFVSKDINAMAAREGGVVFKTLTAESLPITVERTYEKPVTLETKTFQPVVLQKTLEQEAIKRKVETIPATIERREWVQGTEATGTRVLSVEEDIKNKSEVREVESHLTQTGAAVGQERTTSVEISKGAMHEVAADVVPLDEVAIRQSNQPGMIRK